MVSSLAFLTHTLLQKYKIKIDKNEFNFQMASHPSYPSLYAITDVLSHFNIENIALKVAVNHETLDQLPNNFIAQIKNNEGDHLVLVCKINSNLDLMFEDKKHLKISSELFLKQFTGVIVAVEKDDNKLIGQSKKPRLNKYLLYATAGIFLSLFIVSRPDYFISLHFMLAVVGVFISSLIIKHDMGISSTL